MDFTGNRCASMRYTNILFIDMKGGERRKKGKEFSSSFGDVGDGKEKQILFSVRVWVEKENLVMIRLFSCIIKLVSIALLRLGCETHMFSLFCITTYIKWIIGYRSKTNYLSETNDLCYLILESSTLPLYSHWIELILITKTMYKLIELRKGTASSKSKQTFLSLYVVR